jgi:threonine/homoserine/homoserine lactone efflux protein
LADLLAFLVIAVIVVVTPGQDTALTIRNTLSGGRSGGFATALGVVSGQAIWTLAAATGLAALLVASEPVFEAVRLFGAAYLVYLGVQSLVAAWRGRYVDHVASGSRALTPARAFRQGFISNLGNPKMVVFFTSLLPQFVNVTGPTLLPLLGLGFICCALTLVWLALYSVIVDRAGDFVRRSGLRRAIEFATGVVLTAFGIRLAAEKI